MGEMGEVFRVMKEMNKQARGRRFDRAVSSRVIVEKWAEQRGFELKVLNDGYHWQIKTPSGVFNWWPSTGKLQRPGQSAGGRYNTSAMMRTVELWQVEKGEAHD